MHFRYLTSRASPHEAINSPSSLQSGNIFLILHVSMFMQAIVAGRVGHPLTMQICFFWS